MRNYCQINIGKPMKTDSYLPDLAVQPRFADEPVVGFITGAVPIAVASERLSSEHRMPPAPHSDGHVAANAERRRFSAEYKIRILQEIDRCSKRGEIADLLRREDLYFSHINSWRKQRVEAIEAGVAPKRRGRKRKTDDSLGDENKRLRRENRRLKAKLRQIAAIVTLRDELLCERAL